MEGNDAGIQVKNLELGTEAKSVEKWCFLACSLWLAQLAFLYNTETLALDDPAHSGLVFSKSIIIQKNCSEDNSARPIQWRQLLSWGSLFLSDTSFHEVDGNWIEAIYWPSTRHSTFPPSPLSPPTFFLKEQWNDAVVKTLFGLPTHK